MQRVVFVTARELQIIRAHLKHKRLRRIRRLSQALTKVGLWLHLAAGLAAIAWFFYIIPYERLSHEGFGLGLYGKQTIQTALAAIESRCGKPIYVGTIKKTGTKYWQFHTQSQQVIALYNPSQGYDFKIRIKPLGDEQPGTAADVVTGAGITLGSSTDQVYSRYANSITGDPNGLAIYFESYQSWLANDYPFNASSSIDGQQRVVRLNWRDAKADEIYVFYMPLLPYASRAYSYLFATFLGSPVFTDFAFILLFVLPLVLLYIFLAFGIGYHQRRLWFIWLFAVLPYLPFWAWMCCRHDVMNYLSYGTHSNIALVVAVAGIPLLIGLYSALTIGLGADYEEVEGLLSHIRIAGHIEKFVFNTASWVRSIVSVAALGLAVALISVIACYPFAVLISGFLQPYQ